MDPLLYSPIDTVLNIDADPDVPLTDVMVAQSDFILITALRTGSYGEVFLSRDPATGDQVAVKRLFRFSKENDHIWYQREIEVLGSVSHSTLLRLRGYSAVNAERRSGESPIIVTDYHPNGSLQEVIDKSENSPVLNASQILKVIYGIAVGMLILHSKQIIHRDLKPSNILLDANLEPKIADFGLSKFLGGRDPDPTPSPGTPAFQAPELITGATYDFSVDVYAFGMIVYSLLTGRNPFPALHTSYVIQDHVVHGERPPLTDAISPAFGSLISGCWDDHPLFRPSFKQIFCFLNTDLFDQNSLREYKQRIVIPSSILDSLPPLDSYNEGPSAEMRNLVASADGGDGENANRVGCLLRDGEYWVMNCARAAHYFKIAADNGHTRGMVNLGLMLEAGEGLPSDPAQAAEWFLRAHRLKDIEGTLHRARVLMHGLGVAKNEESADALYELAAERGHPGARSLLGYPPVAVPVPIPQRILQHIPEQVRGSSPSAIPQSPPSGVGHQPNSGGPNSAPAAQVFKVVLLGNSEAGKTALMQRYRGLTDYQTVSTIGVDFCSKTFVINERTVRVDVYDTAGQERFRGLIPTYCRGAHGALLVFDVTDRTSFTDLPKWLDFVRGAAPPDIDIMIVATKCDTFTKDPRVVFGDEGAEYAQSEDLKYFETSAATVTQADFESWFRDMVLRRPLPVQETQLTESENRSQCRC
jgi:small GTP-binding protein